MGSEHRDQQDSIGKLVRGDRYIHISGISYLSYTTRTIINKAVSVTDLKMEVDFNVVKIRRGNSVVSLLQYARFFEDPFPALNRSIIVDITKGTKKSRTYSANGNRPILHKKELLLAKVHPKRRMFESLTDSLESIGISPNRPGLGFTKQWTDYLSQRGITIQDHKIATDI